MNDRTRRLLPCAPALVLALLACRSSERDIPLEALDTPAATQLLSVEHHGPPVVAGASGPARFVEELTSSFDPAHARELLEFIDGFYRAPGNDGFEAVLDRLERDLRQAGFGSSAGLELFFIEQPYEWFVFGDREERHEIPAWTPLSGSVTLIAEDGQTHDLHRFEQPGDVDRTILPINAPAADVEATVALDLESLKPGQILVIKATPRPSVVRRALADGAVAVVSSNLEPYNVDPNGTDRHLDAVKFYRLPYGSPIPVLMISPRSYEAIESTALADPEARLRLRAEVRFDQRPLRTLVAVVRGSDRPEEAFALVSHVQEPGANDNATGVVSLVEGARSLARLLQDGRLERPSRSLVFLWGDEYRQTSSWLDSTDMKPVGGISSDMTGALRSQTGAICLLERMPDPGAVTPLPPDEHTRWGVESTVTAEEIVPNGLAVIARCALADVAALEPGWETAEHPYEGGSDHAILFQRGLPTALFWHFPDFAYHTSLDRLSMVDIGEIRRTGAAILATALCAADPRPADLDRYLRTLEKERLLRVAAAQEAGNEDLAELWREWCAEARQWLRVECLRIPESER
jgi:aminopeptidase YwaD